MPVYFRRPVTSATACVPYYNDNPTRKFLTNQIAAFFKCGPIKLIYSDNPTRKFLTYQTAAFFKFGPIKNTGQSEKTTVNFSAKKCMSK
jgi:hypothetical protein